MSLVQLCHCGHDIATHFKHKHTCLGMLCDCRSYRDRDLPLPKAPKVVMRIPAFDEDEDPPITPRMSHPVWCTCNDCMAAAGTP